MDGGWGGGVGREMGIGIWDLGFGIWGMGFGEWELGYGILDLGLDVGEYKKKRPKI